ncbi:MAG TPA: asparagine synthase (glutamine-hydrolyzing) [Terriglobia bacterium]|jgi:asparagine synthase (glutamine-hydrolysing)
MCGISGVLGWRQDLSQSCPDLTAMSAALRHRGPDGSGVWRSAHIALAHRRLCVIDPSGGSQPMLYKHADRTFAVSYNGEIYNFRELRRELESRRHRFQTQSDTEVLLAAYAEWGAECINHFNGIFAFALWDDYRQMLVLARDRLGVKPLFYTELTDSILFASEIKSLLAHPAVKAEVDNDGLAELFSPVQLRTPGFTIYRNVLEVGAGEYITFNREGRRSTRYWSLISAPHTDDVDTTVENIRNLLEDTVRRQLIADVPVVTMLSGGIDSSGVTALAARELGSQGKSLNTYSVDPSGGISAFRDADQPSTDGFWAGEVSQFLGTHHHFVTVSPQQLLEDLSVPTIARDAPGFGQLDTSLYLLCKRIKQRGTVALSGETADEIFAGYSWYHSPDALKIRAFPWLVTMPPAATGPQSLFWVSPQIREKAQPLAYLQRRYEEATANIPKCDGEDPLLARRREIFYLTLTNWLQMLLDRKDRMSMAAGLEVRVPFCDHRLVEYLWNVPWEMQTIDGQEKSLLRRAWAGLVPEGVRLRKKSAYPVSDEPEYLAGLRRLTIELLNAQSAVCPFVNVPAVKAIAEGQIPGMAPHVAAILLERVIQIDIWLKHYRVSIR